MGLGELQSKAVAKYKYFHKNCVRTFLIFFPRKCEAPEGIRLIKNI
jgi:hypothetical protein